MQALPSIELASALVAPLVSAFVGYQIWVCLKNRQFTAVYWFSLMGVFCLPSVIDAWFGLPRRAGGGLLGHYFGSAELGIWRAVCFAAGHVAVTALCQRFRSGSRKRLGVLRRLDDWARIAMTAPVFRAGLSVLFGAGVLGMFVERGDLTRQWNDFLFDPSAAKAYFVYCYFAATPLAAVVFIRFGLRHPVTVLVCAVSALAAYFMAVRYYVFPFLGFTISATVICGRVSLLKRAAGLALAGLTAWVVFGYWGIVRDLNIRASPTAVLSHIELGDFFERLRDGGELATRLTYYHLMGKLNDDRELRGAAVFGDLAKDTAYPAVLRLLGLEQPVSTSARVYILVSGVDGTGVSFTPTVFGSDWFNWGWFGVVVGGVMLGLSLRLIDCLQGKYGHLFAMASPMVVLQLILWARMGLDLSLGLWTKSFLPLFVLLLVAVRTQQGARAPRCAGIHDVRFVTQQNPTQRTVAAGLAPLHGRMR